MFSKVTGSLTWMSGASSCAVPTTRIQVSIAQSLLPQIVAFGPFIAGWLLKVCRRCGAPSLPMKATHVTPLAVDLLGVPRPLLLSL